MDYWKRRQGRQLSPPGLSLTFVHTKSSEENVHSPSIFWQFERQLADTQQLTLYLCLDLSSEDPFPISSCSLISL